MSKVHLSSFDPFSVFKYHATCWTESRKDEKMILVAGLAVETILVLALRYFLNMKSNLILPNRVSHYADSAVILAVVYVALTALIGFRIKTLKKIEKAELITKLLPESQSKKIPLEVNMSKVPFSLFDPFSVFKYHAACWRGSSKDAKMILVATLAVKTILVLALRYFLNMNSNLILPNRVSHYADSAVILAVVYIVFTAYCGFIIRTHRKIREAELINKHLLEAQEKKNTLI